MHKYAEHESGSDSEQLLKSMLLISTYIHTDIQLKKRIQLLFFATSSL